jgi:hypothetical protein
MFRKIFLSVLTVALIAGAGLTPKDAMAYECWVRLVDEQGIPIEGVIVSVRYLADAEHGWYLMEDEGNGWYCDWRDFPGWWGQVTNWKVQYYGLYAPYDPPTNPTAWRPLQPNSFTWHLVVGK